MGEERERERELLNIYLTSEFTFSLSATCIALITPPHPSLSLSTYLQVHLCRYFVEMLQKLSYICQGVRPRLQGVVDLRLGCIRCAAGQGGKVGGAPL